MYYYTYKNTIMSTIIHKHCFPSLGRWNIESCEKRINTKVDLANYDNCGISYPKINKMCVNKK